MSGNSLVYGLAEALPEGHPVHPDMRSKMLTGDEEQNFKAKLRNDPKPLGRQFIESADCAIENRSASEKLQDFVVEGLKTTTAFIYRSARVANDRDGKSI